MRESPSAPCDVDEDLSEDWRGRSPLSFRKRWFCHVEPADLMCSPNIRKIQHGRNPATAIKQPRSLCCSVAICGLIDFADPVASKRPRPAANWARNAVMAKRASFRRMLQYPPPSTNAGKSRRKTAAVLIYLETIAFGVDVIHLRPVITWRMRDDRMRARVTACVPGFRPWVYIGQPEIGAAIFHEKGGDHGEIRLNSITQTHGLLAHGARAFGSPSKPLICPHRSSNAVR